MIAKTAVRSIARTIAKRCLAGLPWLSVLLVPGVSHAASGHDLSAWGMFMMADWVVKGVMLGLVFASVLTWTIWLVKTLELAKVRKQAQESVTRLNRSASLREAAQLVSNGSGATQQFMHAAEHELQQSRQLPIAGIKERMASRFAQVESAEARQAKQGVSILATVGSTAPFIGLFGTVWGIMNSFIGIAESQTTNLAVVAPGIAEALLATALGLVAAIPAVMMYNQFARKLTDYRALMATIAAEILRLVSLDLDRQHNRLAAAATEEHA